MLPVGRGGLAATLLSLPVFSPFHVLSDLADPLWWVAPMIAWPMLSSLFSSGSLPHPQNLQLCIRPNLPSPLPGLDAEDYRGKTQHGKMPPRLLRYSNSSSQNYSGICLSPVSPDPAVLTGILTVTTLPVSLLWPSHWKQTLLPVLENMEIFSISKLPCYWLTCILFYVYLF